MSHVNTVKSLKAMLEQNREIVGKCWVWVGSMSGGYPVTLRLNRQQLTIGRTSLHVYRGFDLTACKRVNRTCGTLHCFNPDHLEPRRQIIPEKFKAALCTKVINLMEVLVLHRQVPMPVKSVGNKLRRQMKTYRFDVLKNEKVGKTKKYLKKSSLYKMLASRHTLPGTRWAVYENRDKDHVKFGTRRFLAIGPENQFQDVPLQLPDTQKEAGWRYLFIGWVTFPSGYIKKNL